MSAPRSLPARSMSENFPNRGFLPLFSRKMICGNSWFENDVDDDSGYSLEMGWLCGEIADDWQVLFLCVLPKMTRGKTLKSEKIDGTWRMDGWFLLLDAVMLLHHRARQPYMTMMLQ